MGKKKASCAGERRYRIHFDADQPPPIDGLQGPVIVLPTQLARARLLIDHDPHAALSLALSVAATMANDLWRSVMEPA